MSARLYRAAWVEGAGENYDMEFYGQPLTDPDGWAEFCDAKWGEYKPFFFPTTDRIYKSRSAAQRRVDIINYWGGKAEVLECTPVWEPVSDANKRREGARLQKRINRMIGELDAINPDWRDLDHVTNLRDASPDGYSLRDAIDVVESRIEKSHRFEQSADGSLAGLYGANPGGLGGSVHLRGDGAEISDEVFADVAHAPIVGRA